MNKKICLHKEISLKIKNLILSSIIISVALFINMFHIPFPIYHGIELEKIEFGIIILCSLIGTMKLKTILIAAAILPFLDLLLHGHYAPIVFPEMLSNLLIIFTTFIFWNLFLKNKKSFLKNILFLFFTILITLIIRFFHYYMIILIIIPDIVEKTTNVDNKDFYKMISILIPILIIAIIKYFIIFSTTILIKNKLKNINFYNNQIN